MKQKKDQLADFYKKLESSNEPSDIVIVEILKDLERYGDFCTHTDLHEFVGNMELETQIAVSMKGITFLKTLENSGVLEPVEV